MITACQATTLLDSWNLTKELSAAGALLTYVANVRKLPHKPTVWQEILQKIEEFVTAGMFRDI